MDLIQAYSRQLKKQYDHHPKRALQMIRLGLTYEHWRSSRFGDREIPVPYRKIYASVIRSVQNALSDPENTVWTNIFGPVEIFQSMGLQGISIEALATILAGFHTEDEFIDRAESLGISSTLCSYHKNFIGAVDAGLLPSPSCAVTTSTICDGNISTFRFAAQERNLPFRALDVPYEESPEGIHYLTGQLVDMIHDLENITGRRFEIQSLREVIERRNRSNHYYRTFLDGTREHCYPNTMGINQSMLLAALLNSGSREMPAYFRELSEDVLRYPGYTGKRILWIHLQPYYQETLREYFNLSRDYNIQISEFPMVSMEEMDSDDPVQAVAKRMIRLSYNGTMSRKLEWIRSLAERYQPDAVIHYCHWGCRQSSGGVTLIRNAMAEMGIPILVLDGDALDRRNSHDGQIRTRLEAFMEMIGGGR